MVDNDTKEKIKLYVNVLQFCQDRYVATDSEWDKYFIENYNNECAIEFDEEDFVTYDVNKDHVYIKDIFGMGSGVKLFKKVMKLADEARLPIRVHVHFINYRALNVIMRRFKFKIIDMTGQQYLLERRK